jgi:hypothetical protein
LVADLQVPSSLADMEATQSNMRLSAIEYALTVVSVALLLSVYLAGGFAISRQHLAPHACSVNAQPEYAPVRG